MKPKIAPTSRHRKTNKMHFPNEVEISLISPVRMIIDRDMKGMSARPIILLAMTV